MRDRPPFESGLDRELRYHFERLVREFIAAGVDPEEARRRARLDFGGLEQIKEECRDVRGQWLRDFAKDLRYASRMLRRSPVFLSVSVLSLALGIGGNTAIFSLIDAVMLRSLPVRDPSRIVQIVRLSEDNEPWNLSYPLYLYFRERLKSIAVSAAELESSPAIVLDGDEEIVSGELVTGDHYRLLGLQPAAGRLLGPEDDVASPAAPAAVISYAFWQRRFGLNRAVIGKTFRHELTNRIFTIVGVTPQRYRGPRMGSEPDVTLPLGPLLNEHSRQEATFNWLNMLGRLAPGATIGQANAELQVLWKAFQQPIAAAMPAKDRPRYLRIRAAVIPGAGGITELRGEYNHYTSALLVLMGIVALVLLLACANLSGLLLARAASREREISIRLAIGAGRSRLMRQFLAESFVLAVLGGAAGLLLARWFIQVLVTMMARGEPLLLSTGADWRILLFTASISVIACVLSGAAPGLHAVRANLTPGLKQARTGGSPRLGKALVVAQLAISMVLVIGATLFVDTLVQLYRVDRGVRTDGMLVFRVRTNERYSSDRQWAALGAIVERLNALPGVASASAADIIPLSGNNSGRGVQVDGYTYRPDESEETAFNAVAPHFFATIGTPLLMGREFTLRDDRPAPRVAIVNESFARYFFAGSSPLGRRVTALGVSYRIVGMVKDAKYQNLRQGLIRTVYIPLLQREGAQPNNQYFMVRARSGDPMRLAPFLDRAVHEADPGLRIRMVETYSDLVNDTIVTERIMGALGGFFGVLALIVACLGIFGVMAFQLSRRTNEIGLRMALGATRSGIVSLVLREVATMLVIGCVIGAAIALPLSRLAAKILFGIRPTEPSVFVTAAAILAFAALAAACLPARRAARVDPLTALRHE